MAKRRKNKSNIPRRKRMNRSRRLQSAVHFIPKYDGKNLVSGYSKYFGVDKLCAVKELEMLGHSIKSSYKKELRDAAEQRKSEKEKRKKLKQENQLEQDKYWYDSDETFAFIAGYTSGGIPFGITWEEWGVEEKNQSKGKKLQ